MELNLAVYTSKSIIERRRPILVVFHDEEGDWQFLPSLQDDEIELAIITLGQAIGIDESITEVLSLPNGNWAFRENAISKWQIAKH